MTKTYRVSLWNQIRLLLHAILQTFILLCAGFYLSGWTLPTQVMLLIDFCVSLLPTSIVHIQYLRKNKGAELTIDSTVSTLSYNKAHLRYFGTFQDIRKIIRTSSYGRGSWYSFGDYRYCRIVCRNGTELIFTCLLVPDIEKDLVQILKVKEETRLKVIALL